MKLKSLVALVAALSVFGFPAQAARTVGHCGRHGGGHRSVHCPPSYHCRPYRGWHGRHHHWHGGYHRHHSYGYYNPEAEYLLPVATGGFVGSALRDAANCHSDVIVVNASQPVQTSPTVVQQPIVVEQPDMTAQVVVEAQARVIYSDQPVTNPEKDVPYVDEPLADGNVARVWGSGCYELLTE